VCGGWPRGACFVLQMMKQCSMPVMIRLLASWLSTAVCVDGFRSLSDNVALFLLQRW